MRIVRSQVMFLLILTSKAFSKNTYVLPSIEFEALSPTGIRVTMPDDGFSSFALHCNLKRGTELKPGQVKIPRAKQGYWIFIDKNYELKTGDTIFYAVVVFKNDTRYQMNGVWNVREFVSGEDFPNCEISETTTPCWKRICKNTLIFSEEFDNADRFNWHKENMFPQEPDYPFNAYSQDRIRIVNGTLFITPARTFSALSAHWDMGFVCTGEAGTKECIQTSSGAQILPPVVSGKISTRSSFSFRYGRIEVRAKLPIGDWLIPEINLEPLFNEYGKQQYGSGLMRIACVKGNQEFSRELYGGPIVCDTEPCRSKFLKTLEKPSGRWNEDFHVYSLIWKPDGIQLFVDGLLYGDINSNNTSNTHYFETYMPHAKMWRRGSSIAPLDKMFYISLGVRVGGINDFPDIPEKPWKNKSNKAICNFWENVHFWYKTWVTPELIVDYVRVYSL